MSPKFEEDRKKDMEQEKALDKAKSSKSFSTQNKRFTSRQTPEGEDCVLVRLLRMPWISAIFATTVFYLYISLTK